MTAGKGGGKHEDGAKMRAWPLDKYNFIALGPLGGRGLALECVNVDD